MGSQDLAFARQYLEGRLREGQHRPDLHQTINSVYSRYLKILSDAPDQYASSVGDMFDVWKSETIDRQLNLRRLAEKIGHIEAAAVHAKMEERVKATRSYPELASLSAEVQEAARKAGASEIARRDALTAFLGFLVLIRAEPEKNKPGRRAQARSAFQEMRSLDPDFSFSKLRNHLPYRAMTYYTEEQLSMLEQTFAECKA